MMGGKKKKRKKLHDERVHRDLETLILKGYKVTGFQK